MFSLPTGTEMFHFPAFPPHTLYIQVQVTGHDSSQVSPFGHPRITARLPTPQGLSQATTSFIGSRCQGIHHVPFIACHTPQTHPTAHPPTAGSRPGHNIVRGTKHQNSNCYKDARVHYKKTKHPAQQPTTPHHHGGPAESRHTKPTTTPTPHQQQEHRHARMRPQNPNSVPPPQHPHNGDPQAGETVIVPLVSYPQPARPAPRTGTQTNQPGPPHPPRRQTPTDRAHPHARGGLRWFCMCSLERR